MKSLFPSAGDNCLATDSSLSSRESIVLNAAACKARVVAVAKGTGNGLVRKS